MHFQKGMAKLIRCPRGAIFDVLVDIREGSPSFGRWESFELSDENHHQLYVPDGFAHGFVVLSKLADVVYKLDYYDAELESGFRYDDPDVDIAWPSGLELQTSARDREVRRCCASSRRALRTAPAAGGRSPPPVALASARDQRVSLARRSPGCPHSCRRRSANAPGSFGGRQRSALISSGRPPRAVASTGTPAAIASSAA